MGDFLQNDFLLLQFKMNKKVSSQQTFFYQQSERKNSSKYFDSRALNEITVKLRFLASQPTSEHPFPDSIKHLYTKILDTSMDNFVVSGEHSIENAKILAFSWWKLIFGFA